MTARFAVRVSPGAARTEIVGRHGDRWKLRVAAPPDRGRANEAVVRLLAASLGVQRDRVRIVAGAAAKDKVIEVEGLTAREAERILGTAGRKGE